MIPKIIHQTWKNNTLPEKFIAYQEKVKALHPATEGWEYRLWTDEDNLAFVTKEFPDFLKIYNSFPKNIMRSDMIRYLIMYKVGGIYLDLDYEMLKQFDLLNYGLVLPYNRMKKYGDKYDAFGNCIFASVPGHPFWKYVIDDFKEGQDYDTFFKSLSAPYITKSTTLEEAITGPGLLTRIFFSHQSQLTDYVLPEKEIFHPLTPRSESEYTKILSKNESWGIHHCSGTWRDKSFLGKVKLKVDSLFSSR